MHAAHLKAWPQEDISALGAVPPTVWQTHQPRADQLGGREGGKPGWPGGSRCPLRTAHSHRLTHSTEVCKAVLSLLRVDQVISALLGGCSLQHCFKQRVGRRHECNPAGRPASGLGYLSVAHSLIFRNEQPLQIHSPEAKAGGRKDDAWPPWPLLVLISKGTRDSEVLLVLLSMMMSVGKAWLPWRPGNFPSGSKARAVASCPRSPHSKARRDKSDELKAAEEPTRPAQAPRDHGRRGTLSGPVLSSGHKDGSLLSCRWGCAHPRPCSGAPHGTRGLPWQAGVSTILSPGDRHSLV